MNKRRRTRVESQKDATVVFSNKTLMGKLSNVSLKGCLISPSSSEPIPKTGVELKVVIHLETDCDQFDIKLRGRAVRSDEKEIAIEFTEIPPESFQRLLKFVQYNASDPDEIEDELGISVFEPKHGGD